MEDKYSEEWIKAGTGREVWDVEIKHFCQEKMRKNIQGLRRKKAESKVDKKHTQFVEDDEYIE